MYNICILFYYYLLKNVKMEMTNYGLQPWHNAQTDWIDTCT